MIKNIILITLILSIFLIGCQAPTTETPSEAAPEAEEEISIDEDVSEIDTLDEDLGLEDLENIEAELDEINR